MHVVATAGHVDHGKSALVHALTGSDPDRLEEEHRRGLSIQLGYAWTTLPRVGDVALVDVPGHERFITTMLSGIGPVPAVLFVVAADDPWMPQAAEHLAALDALDVRHGVVAVTRCDLADPAPAAGRATAELGLTSLHDSPVVHVSSRTGTGLEELRGRLADLVSGLPTPDVDADVRLWVDRRFNVDGAGTVVTGTLPAGTVRRGDTLSTGSGLVRVRGLQSLGRPTDAVSGVARVALHLGGDLASLDSSRVLVTPESHLWTETIDVRLTGPTDRLPLRPMLHVGALALTTRCRSLGGDLARLDLARPLPLRVGDRAVLRDPGDREVWGVRVLDPLPPPLRRRGAAADRERSLRGAHGGAAEEVRRREVVDLDTLRRIGVPDAGAADGVRAGRWLVSADRAARARDEVATIVEQHRRDRPLERGLPLGVLAERLGLPTPELVTAILPPPLLVVDGRVLGPGGVVLPVELEQALDALSQDLASHPFSAPTTDRLQELGLDRTSVAAAAEAGRVLRLSPGVVLLPGADARAVEVLAGLAQPFTTSAARSALGTSRRVVLPLLEHLDRAGLTRRLPDDRRTVRQT